MFKQIIIKLEYFLKQVNEVVLFYIFQISILLKLYSDMA